MAMWITSKDERYVRVRVWFMKNIKALSVRYKGHDALSYEY
jgi:hypothetical protein